MGTTLETRRDYLVRLGLAKPGRGKFSNAAKEALSKADAEGREFLDGPSPKGNGSGPVLSTVPVTGDKTTTVAKVGLVDYMFPSDFRYPEAEYKAVEVVGKKEHSLRECCNSCKVSLTNHMCDSPTIHNNVRVTIERR